jgi:hypothetical protein
VFEVFGAQLDEVELSALGQQVMHAWHYCQGWRPELLASYLAVYPMADADLLPELLQHVAQEIASHVKRQQP